MFASIVPPPTVALLVADVEGAHDSSVIQELGLLRASRVLRADEEVVKDAETGDDSLDGNQSGFGRRKRGIRKEARLQDAEAGASGTEA